MNEEKLYLHVTLYEFRKGVTIETAVKNIQDVRIVHQQLLRNDLRNLDVMISTLTTNVTGLLA